MKEWISPESHPNVGIEVKMWIRDTESGKNSYRPAYWNRTHWMLKSGPIPPNYELVGWSV